MSDEPNAPADLSNLGIDLSEIFRPSWTTETAGPSDATARLAAKFDEGDRPARGDRPDRSGRQGGRDGDRGPRRSGPPTDRDRGARPGGRRDAKSGGRDREDRRERRPEPAPIPTLEGWSLELLPDAIAVDGIAKQVRTRAKAYPLFELARLILQLSDRYSIKLTPASDQIPGLFRVKLDGSLWTSRKEAVNHLLSKHLGKFYRRSSVATEPPKGAFAVVAQCGMSGVLLGPPNHHEYTSRLITLHSSRFKNMPFEMYKSRVRMVRDEALLEQWKGEQSTKTIYVPVTPGSEGTESEEPASIEPPDVPVAESEPVIETPAPVEAESPAEESPAAETPAEETVLEVIETSEPSDEGTPVESSSENSEATPEATISEVGGLTLEEATAHFQEHHAANEVEDAEGELRISGRAALHESTQLLRESLLTHLREMDRFPLPLAQAVGRELTNRGLQLFKSHRKIIHVSMVRPKYLDRTTTPVAQGFVSILEYLEAHPNQPRDKQWNALLSGRTEIPEEGEVAPREKILECREKALGADLLWLLHQGHVIDFAMGNLQAATRPAPKQPAKKESAAAPLSTSPNDTLIGDTDEVQPGGSSAMPSENPQDMITEPTEHHEPLEIPSSTTLDTPPPVDPGEFLPKE